jgi:type I restriction enzyme S subunit
MVRYQPYPQYSSNGCPTTWDHKRLRFALRMNPSKSEMCIDETEMVSFVPMDAVGEYGGIRLNQEKELSEIGSGYTYFCDDDVVVAKITPCFENGKGALAKGLVNKTAFGTTELHVLRANPEQLEPEFLFYLTISNLFRKLGESEMFGAGGQKRVPESFFKDFRAGLPSLDEQQAIARFLDFKTAQIDALIAKQQALLDKLAEKRTALISHVVTKGLNPSASMKDTKAAWLGDIPNHWEAKRLKFLISEPLKYGANESAELSDPDLPRYIRITDVNDDGTLREETFRSLPQDVADNYLLSDGDILLARSGATVGKSFIYKPSWGVAAYAGYLIRARMSDTMDADFAYLFLQSSSYWQWLNSVSIQATIQNVSAEKYASLVFPVPPIDEQLDIVSHLLVQLKRIDVQRERAVLVVDRLVEYRSAVITNAVTGKIDVRGFRAPQSVDGIAL